MRLLGFVGKTSRVSAVSYGSIKCENTSSLALFFFFHLFSCMWVLCVCGAGVFVCGHESIHVEVKEQLEGMNSLLSPHGF